MQKSCNQDNQNLYTILASTLTWTRFLSEQAQGKKGIKKYIKKDTHPVRF